MTQENLPKDEAFQKKWKHLLLICKIRIAAIGVFLANFLWFLILWHMVPIVEYLMSQPHYASIIIGIVVQLAILIRTACLKPNNRCWLRFYYILDILNAISLIGTPFVLFHSGSRELESNETPFMSLETIFEGPLVSPKVFIAICMIVAVISVIAMIANLVLCSQLLYCSGYDAHYTQMTNHHGMSQVSLSGNMDQPQFTHRPSYNEYKVDIADDAKLVIDV